MGQEKVIEEITEMADQDQKQKDLQLITNCMKKNFKIELREK